MRDAVIVSAARTAVGQAPRGTLRETPPVELAMAAVREALARAPGLDPAEVEDVVLGCAMPEGGQGLNIARQVALGAGLPVSASAMTVNRFCASGLQALALAHAGRPDRRRRRRRRRRHGVDERRADDRLPLHARPDAWPTPGRRSTWAWASPPRRSPTRFGVDREAQDAWGLRCHQRAAAAQGAGRFRDEIVPVAARWTEVEPTGVRQSRDVALRRRRGHPPRRRRARMAGAAAGVRRRRHRHRRQQLPDERRRGRDGRDDGERAAALGLEPLGRLVSVRDRRRAPEIMGIGPGRGRPQGARQGRPDARRHRRDRAERGVRRPGRRGRAAARAGRGATNVNGGAIALGHPLGATGAKLTVQMLSELARREERYGLVTMCVGGGQGAAGVIEWLGGPPGRPRRSGPAEEEAA